jgi:Tol biopolymer transport system component
VRISPDGKGVALMSGRPQSIAVIDLDRRVTTRLSTEGTGWLPVWSPDGRRVLFSSVLTGSPNGNIYWRLADGSGPVQRLTSGELTQNPRAITPDGKVLIFHQGIDAETGFDISAVSLPQGAEVKPLIHAKVSRVLSLSLS